MEQELTGCAQSSVEYVFQTWSLRRAKHFQSESWGRGGERREIFIWTLSPSLPLPWENPALHSDGGLVLWLGHVTASLTNERRLLWFKRKQRQVSVGTVGSKPCRLTHVLQAWAANNKITSFLSNVDSALWENKLWLALGNLFLTENLWKRFTIRFHLLTSY